jgi:hypothetical protein
MEIKTTSQLAAVKALLWDETPLPLELTDLVGDYLDERVIFDGGGHHGTLTYAGITLPCNIYTDDRPIFWMKLADEEPIEIRMGKNLHPVIPATDTGTRQNSLRAISCALSALVALSWIWILSATYIRGVAKVAGISTWLTFDPISQIWGLAGMIAGESPFISLTITITGLIPVVLRMIGFYQSVGRPAYAAIEIISLLIDILAVQVIYSTWSRNIVVKRTATGILAVKRMFTKYRRASDRPSEV